MVSSHTDVCSYQKAWALDIWIRKYIHDPHKIVGGYIKEGQTVLDLGCGPGFFSLAMAEMVNLILQQLQIKPFMFDRLTVSKLRKNKVIFKIF